jgi:hypothetical protein
VAIFRTFYELFHEQKSMSPCGTPLPLFCLEGLEITTQTEQDCERLMSGKVTVNELMREILARPSLKVQPCPDFCELLSRHLSVGQQI